MAAREVRRAVKVRVRKTEDGTRGRAGAGAARDATVVTGRPAPRGAIGPDQARALGEAFLQVAHALGRFRFARWSELSVAERQSLENDEWGLLAASSTLTTKAVDLVLGDLKDDLATIAEATARAQKVIDGERDVKKALKIAASFVTLGGAILSGNAVGIAASATAALAATGA